MDNPGLGRVEHWQALAGLARINWWSCSAHQFWPFIAGVYSKRNGPIRVLDIACGGGDTVIRLARRAQAKRLSIQFSGCDISANALEFARLRATNAKVTIDFFPCNVLLEDLPRHYDVITSSLFMHHLDEVDVIALLQRMACSSRELILVNDLQRSRFGWRLAYFGARALTRSHTAHVDAPRSVQGAYTAREAETLAKKAGLNRAEIKRTWPFRWLLSWHKSEGTDK
jgi:2-polyprenyl-3-methyl-5-hydroxy-6-metoxy-1,4-benzoquinol methylase